MWSNGYRPFNGGQKLFSIEDFDSGRVSYPEEASRGVRQVVKSTDANIESHDHVWSHQMVCLCLCLSVCDLSVVSLTKLSL